jgi:hypothetical protein
MAVSMLQTLSRLTCRTADASSSEDMLYFAGAGHDDAS